MMQVVKIEGHEADDVVATLVDKALQRGYRVVIASPDKDFKQLISEDVQIVMPMPKSDNWSFYTVKHYNAQYHCDPSSDLSLSKYVRNLFRFPFHEPAIWGISAISFVTRYNYIQYGAIWDLEDQLNLRISIFAFLPN